VDYEPHRRAVALEEVQAQAGRIEAIGRRHGVRNVRVFGSVARGGADEASDLDLLVEAEPWVGMFALSAFVGDVEDLLGVETHAVTLAWLKARIRPRVVAEAVPL